MINYLKLFLNFFETNSTKIYSYFLEWLKPIRSFSINKIYALCLFVSFSAFILYIFYNRLLRERLPRDLSLPVSNLQKYIYIYIIFVNLVLILLLIWDKYKIYLEDAIFEFKAESNIEFQTTSILFVLKAKLDKNVYDIRFKISQTFLGFIYPKFEREYHRYLIACFIVFNQLSFFMQCVCFYSISIIPKFIVVFCFFWDILIRNELYIFYKVLGLLLIPLVLKFICYNYLVIMTNAANSLAAELNNDPHRFQGSEEDLMTAAANITEEDSKKAEENANLFFELERSAWYKKLFPTLKEFFYNLKGKEGVGLYINNFLLFNVLSMLPLTMANWDYIQNELRFPQNLILRLAYSLGWGIILYKSYEETFGFN